MQEDNYAALGNPIAHSKSPEIHGYFASQTKQAITYKAIQTRPEHFSDTLRQFQLSDGKGLNITLPLKNQAYQACHQVSERARQAQAVNTICFRPNGKIYGDTTDGDGLVTDLKNNLAIPIKHCRILILGAGGAVKSILGALATCLPNDIVIANRTMERAHKLVEEHPEISHLTALAYNELSNRHFDLIINGTSASLNNEVPPLNKTVLMAPNTYCYDLMYADKPTAFMDWSKQNGAYATYDGLGMLVEQAALSFELWRGVKPDTRPVIQTLRSKN